MVTLILALAVLVAGTSPALSDTDLVGKWSGTAEFITLGQKTTFGPAEMMLKGKKSPDREGFPLTGQAQATMTVEEQIGQHFHGRWSIDGNTLRYTCTITMDSQFLCSGRQSESIGFMKSADQIRMCWGHSGKAAMTGCADLSKIE